MFAKGESFTEGYHWFWLSFPGTCIEMLPHSVRELELEVGFEVFTYPDIEHPVDGIS